ncbi:MAG: DUF4271 domain-containing protein [Saprospiraceae bacterium]|nr:DUF4271 domain-containing protein [Saprospiraceae bacterium]
MAMLTWALVAQAAAQSIPNPFDIVQRLPESLREAAQVPADVPPDVAANPFNIVEHQAPGSVVLTGGSGVGALFEPTDVLPTGDEMSDTAVFWFLVALLAFLSFSIAAKRNIVGKVWRGFLNDNALNIAQKEAAGLIGSTPYYLLYGSFLLNAGTFAFLIARHFSPKTFNNPGFLVVCLLLAGVLFLAKHILVNILGALFPVANEARRYNFLIMVFNCVLGLFLVPFNFLIAFARHYGDFMVFWTLALAGIFYLYRAMRATAIGSKFLSGNLFHFFLYLCAVEIAPAVVLVKLALLASE